MVEGVILREGRPADASALGSIFYQAFRTIADAHNFPPDLPSEEFATSVLAHFLGHRGFYSVVAEQNGRVVGSNFLDERDAVYGIGPLSVSPTAQDHGVGRQLMQAVLERARSRNALGTRLIQTVYHRRSLALYAKLGFCSQELLACMQGAPPGDHGEGERVRPAREADLKACGVLCKRVHGVDRNGELADAIREGHATVVESGGHLTGYATSVGFFGHQVGETTAALQALISAATHMDGPGILVPVRNAELFRWTLEQGLKIVQPMTLMTTGLYQTPRGAYVPSVLY